MSEQHLDPRQDPSRVIRASRGTTLTAKSIIITTDFCVIVCDSKFFEVINVFLCSTTKNIETERIRTVFSYSIVYKGAVPACSFMSSKASLNFRCNTDIALIVYIIFNNIKIMTRHLTTP